MIQPDVRNGILKELARLGSEDQHRVLDFARTLTETRVQGTPGRDLLGFAGAISDEDADVMDAAIEEGCEQVNPSEW